LIAENSSEVFADFGWWFNTRFFDDVWALDRLLRRFAEVTHLSSSEVTLARNGTASSHAVGVAAWFRTSVEEEARGGKSIDIAVSSRAVGAVGFCL
jgi:hypothetical protein